MPSPLRGVFDADPLDPPHPPLGARGVKVRDSNGRIIGFGWVAAEHANDLHPRSWDWLDEHEPPVRLLG